MTNTPYNPVGWFEIYVQDVERAKKFYEEVFQVQLFDMCYPIDDESGAMTMAHVAMVKEREGTEASGDLVKMQGFDSGGKGIIVFFSAYDCGVEAGCVEAARGRIFSPDAAIDEHGF